MNSRLSQIMIVVGAVVAFLPLLAVDYFLDSYVKGREGSRFAAEVQSLSDEMQRSVYGGLAAINTVVADSPTLCAPTFVSNVQKQLRSEIYLKQILVENLNGVQYCDGYQQTLSYSVLSSELAIPGTSESLTVVQLEGEATPSLKVAALVGGARTVSAFVYISPRLFSGIPKELAPATGLRVRLTDGTDIINFGDIQSFKDETVRNAYVYSRVVADALPMQIELAVPFAELRADYADLDIIITLFAALMSAAFLFLSFHYVRNNRLHGFDLERAINNGELRPYYQPVMDISSGRVSGCEVLIRWEKKGGKLVSPGVFIDYAEATGLAIPMTIKLMEQVRRDLSDLCAEQPGLKIGINLFEGHFRDTNIVDDVQVIFEDSPIGYDQLVFELTERQPLKDHTVSAAAIGGLQALGCRLAIDDAGTGHSNLEYIQTLGADIIKIDRVFVAMIGEDTKNVPVLDGFVSMANDLGVEIIAEGVETEAQALYLRQHGVREAQGFLFAPALKAKPFVALAKALPPVQSSSSRSEDLLGLLKSEPNESDKDGSDAVGDEPASKTGTDG